MSNIIPMYGYDVNNKGVRLSIISTQKWVGKNCLNGYFEFCCSLTTTFPIITDNSLKHKGLKIHTADSDFFILNQNFIIIWGYPLGSKKIWNKKKHW